MKLHALSVKFLQPITSNWDNRLLVARHDRQQVKAAVRMNFYGDAVVDVKHSSSARLIATTGPAGLVFRDANVLDFA